MVKYYQEIEKSPNTLYTIYKTTNNINGKVYIGCHKTTDLDDGYIVSSKISKPGGLNPRYGVRLDKETRHKGYTKNSNV